jgi:anti-sigma B factor antagonist
MADEQVIDRDDAGSGDIGGAPPGQRQADSGDLDVSAASRPDAPGVIDVRVTGEIDMATVGTLDSALHDAVRTAGTTRVVVDFAGVTFCDSSGIAALDRSFGAARARGGALRVVNLGPGIQRILEITGLLDALTAP